MPCSFHSYILNELGHGDKLKDVSSLTTHPINHNNNPSNPPDARE